MEEITRNTVSGRTLTEKTGAPWMETVETAPREEFAPSGRVNLEETLQRAETLTMFCPQCGRRQRFTVPVDLTRLVCKACAGKLDPMEWAGAATDPETGAAVLGDGTPPVNHRLMQRLIATCYRRPEFALKVIEHYRRDWDHAKVQEWGIDKALLLVHAAHAAVQRGHHSYWPFAVLGLAFLAGLLIPFPFGSLFALAGLLVALWLGAQNTRNRAQWRESCRPNAYNPARIADSNRKMVDRILGFCEATQPRNLFFFSGYEPFDLLGQGDANWSLLVDRRKRASGERDDEPASLDLKETYKNIVKRLLAAMVHRHDGLTGDAAGDAAGLPATRFRVDDSVLVSGRDIERDDHRFVDAKGIPQTELDDDTVRQLAEQSNLHYRIYKRVAYYDPQRDLGLVSFLRLAHQGPFTYIESAGTRLLPMVERLMNQYSDEPTADELAEENKGPGWWRRLSYERRRQISFVGIGVGTWLMIASVGSGVVAGMRQALASELGPGVEALGLRYLVAIAAWIIPLILIGRAYGAPPKLDDDWNPKKPSLLEYIVSLGLVGLLPYRREKERKRRRALVGFAKETREWDYAPRLKSLRVWQSRTSARTRFENTDLLLLRRGNDLAVQEAFLQCLEEAGIDTTEFREGTARLNNYGVLVTGDTYNAAQVAAQGAGSVAHDIAFKQQVTQKTKTGSH